MRALLTGGTGMLGSSIIDVWRTHRPDDELVVPSRGDVDLTDPAATRDVVRDVAPDVVIHAAAFVGGIGDKVARPLPYLLDNLRIDASVLAAAVAADVPRYLYVASAAAYPAAAPNPIAEESLFDGRLEPANEGYGLAKLTGLTAVGYAARQTGAAYRSILPSNLYGPRDSFDPSRSHLIASTLLKTHRAHVSSADHVEVWGDGTARREFTFAPDLARWMVASLDDMTSWPEFMNIGAGYDHSIREFYEVASDVVGYRGGLAFDTSKPSGVPRRLVDSTRVRAHGWAPQTTIRDGMAQCYDAFLTRSDTEGLR
ncbi:NAD-dependent epimerase/dehydratase family protein [uncultured Microbacterium sp.]|uniref:NAD-dependent epimerase/dehydratase family protein n=1 Tax=uncultured Microbacterium sp. TaxID=191216 RepID=UPI0025D7136A|nr:NAD-dependent epimerase/dehydratase family protein [uncultured Microbacterium sp.]